MALVPALKKAGELVGEYAPQILTGLGIAGFVTAVGFAIDATPEAHSKIEAEKYKRAKEGDDRPITPIDVVGMTWKDYAPTAIMVVMSGAMVIGGHYMTVKRYNSKLMAMTAAYEMAAQQANKYYEKSKQLAGKQKAEDVRAQVAQDMVNDIPDEKFDNAKGETGDDYFYDALSGQVFKYDLRKFEKNVNEYNHELMTEMWKSVNELYDKIPPLERTIMGDILGYDIEKGLLDFKKPYVAEKNGKAVFVLWPQNYPEVRSKL